MKTFSQCTHGHVCNANMITLMTYRSFGHRIRRWFNQVDRCVLPSLSREAFRSEYHKPQNPKPCQWRFIWHLWSEHSLMLCSWVIVTIILNDRISRSDSAGKRNVLLCRIFVFFFCINIHWKSKEHSHIPEKPNINNTEYICSFSILQ